jgi:transglutaminase-like putative cysteine protease
MAPTMLYDIGLLIEQKYNSPAVGARQVVRIVPPTIPGEQDVIVASLAVDPPPHERHDRRDFFGNGVVEIAYTTAQEYINYKVTARVRRFEPPQQLKLSPTVTGLGEELLTVRSLASDAPHHFLTASPRVPELAQLAAYARDVVPAGCIALDAVETLGLALFRDMKFDPKATHVDTQVADAFAARHGVCQDFSHIMIGCLRTLGIPAGYVSGFLRTIPPKGQPRLQGADAMHAWVRAWCGIELGWVEYDPTNAKFAGTDHIVIARGRDYSDVAPVKGVLRTSGLQDADHAVDVIEVET